MKQAMRFRSGCPHSFFTRPINLRGPRGVFGQHIWIPSMCRNVYIRLYLYMITNIFDDDDDDGIWWYVIYICIHMINLFTYDIWYIHIWCLYTYIYIYKYSHLQIHIIYDIWNLHIWNIDINIDIYFYIHNIYIYTQSIYMYIFIFVST